MLIDKSLARGIGPQMFTMVSGIQCQYIFATVLTYFDPKLSGRCSGGSGYEKEYGDGRGAGDRSEAVAAELGGRRVTE